MGIKHGDSLAVLNVLPDEIEKQGGLAGAARTDDVTMPCALLGGQADINADSGMVILAQQQAMLPENCRCHLGLCCPPLKGRRTDGGGGHMDKAGQFVAVEQHSCPVRLSSQHVLNVFLERVIVVVKRNEFVSAGMREHA